MSASTFIVTVDDKTGKPHNVVEAVAFNEAANARGDWGFSANDGKLVWSFVPEGGIIGTSGALRIKPVNTSGVGYIVVFGYGSVGDESWIGAVVDLPTTSNETAAVAIPKFYGRGEYNKQGVYWTLDNTFSQTNPHTGEKVSIVVTTGSRSGELNGVVTISNSA